MRVRVLIPIAFAAALAAQPPAVRPEGRGPAGLGQLATYLGLSSQQVSDLRQLRADAAQALRPARTDVAAKAKALRQLLQTQNPDPAAVGQATLDLRTARQQVAKARQDYRKQALARLTPEQQTRLQALAEAQQRMPEARQARALGLIEGARMAGRMAAMRGRARWRAVQ